MNRLLNEDLSLLFRRTTEDLKSVAGGFEDDPNIRSPFRFFSPLHYEQNYAYPLFIWLHGPGGTEAEIKHVMPHISLRNYVGLSVRGVVQDPRADRLQRDAFTWEQSAKTVEESLERILEGIRCARDRFNIGGNHRVFLVGNETGGTMAMRIALAAPEHFGGAVSLGGALPNTRQPLASIHRARTLPVLLAHCRDSSVYPTETMCNDLRLLHAAGMKVNLRQYPCGQEVTTKMLSDVNEWMMEQVVGRTCVGSSGGGSTSTHSRLNDQN